MPSAAKESNSRGDEGKKSRRTGEEVKGKRRGKKKIGRMSLTRALLLVAGADLLSGAVAGVPLKAGGLAQPEAALPAGVAGFAAEAPVVPAAPVTPACKQGASERCVRMGRGARQTHRPRLRKAF